MACTSRGGLQVDRAAVDRAAAAGAAPCGHPVDRLRPPAAPACTWIALRLVELQQLVVHLVAARWPGHAAAAVGADGLRVDRAAAGRAAAAGGATRLPPSGQAVRATLTSAGGLQVLLAELACGHLVDRWRPPAAPACGWIKLQQLVVRLVAARWSGHAATLACAGGLHVAELLSLVPRRAATCWPVRAPGRPMACTSRAGLQVDRAAADRAAAAGGASGCRQFIGPCAHAGQRLLLTLRPAGAPGRLMAKT